MKKSQSIRPLSELTADDIAIAGGKAVALGELMHNGICVPNGFVVLTTLTSHHTLPSEVISDVLVAYDALKVPRVAVRSSAVAEDSHGASWAGQLETYLNVTRDDLVACTTKCLQSVYAPRARAYAAQHGINAGRIAVIVQEMVVSRISGVAFSANPVTGNLQQIVIEAGLGLGEAIVSGEITPDTYIVDKRSGRILETHIAAQTRMLVATDTGNTWRATGNAGTSQKMTSSGIGELYTVVNYLESLWRMPVDVEWAINKQGLRVLQCRPITTLQKQPNVEISNGRS